MEPVKKLKKATDNDKKAKLVASAKTSKRGAKLASVNRGGVVKAPSALARPGSVASRATAKGGARTIAKNKLSAKQRDDFRKLLLRMRERLSGQMAALKSESLESNDWVNVEEDGTDVFDQQFALDIVSSENEMLLQIDEALDRVSKETYGACEECGGLINDLRLKALPFVRTCIGCQSQRETRGAVRIRASERLEEM